jgi:glycosyltransferase involved in cell wall biosynthesis
VAKDRPTILQIIPRLDAGGAELAVVEMSQALVRGGARALVLTAGGRLVTDVSRAGGEVTMFPAEAKNPARMLLNARALMQFVSREGVDLIHARSRAPAWSALLAARRVGIPFVTTYHGAYAERSAAKRLYNSVMARGDVVIANSHFTANLIAGRYGTPRERIEVIHRGVDPVRFDPARIEPERERTLRAKWGVTDGERVILHAARLTEWKGQAVVVEAAARLQAKGLMQDAVVVFAGDPQGRDGYVERLQALISTRNLGGRVRLAGHVDDIAAAYRTAHVTVIASIAPEAFGRAAVEAAAMGCPVIVTKLGAPPEILQAEPGESRELFTGWLVQPGNADDLADGLAEALVLTPEKRSAIGSAARRHVLESYTVEAMQRRTLAVYDRLLGTSLLKAFSARAAPRIS